LLAPDQHIWLIDHGVCFHEEPKLRTVIWDFAGEPIPDPLLQAVDRFRKALESNGEVRAGLVELLSGAEVEALARRAAGIVDHSLFPFPGDGRPYPWPLV
jgi:uncharacterized repeat protein (TIGR03843 family)